MSNSRVSAQVKAILEGNGLTWSETDGSLILRFSSALVSASFRAWGKQSLIELRSDVLRN